MKKDYKCYLKNVTIPVLVYGAFTGVLVGTIVYFFKLVAEWLTEKGTELYHVAQQNPLVAVAMFAGAIALAFAMYFLQKWAPETKGGGIPRAEGVLRGLLTFRWLRTGIAVIFNSWISFFVGLPLGSEGPSVLLGTAIGGGTCRLPLSHDSWNRYIMTGGACAGFAVATGAPLTGILFAVEEAHKRFTPMILLMSIVSVLFGVGISNVWAGLIGHEPMALFNVAEFMGTFSMKEVWVPVLLGIAVALFACLYNVFVFFVGKMYDTKLAKIPQWARLVIVFVLTVAIGLIVVGKFNGASALFGGGGLIVNLAQNASGTIPLAVLFVILVVRFFMIAFATGSGVTGGVFIPMLSIGALVGSLMAELFVLLGMPVELYGTVVIITMSAFMGACTRAPITAIVFVVECTWYFSNLFYVAIAVFVSYLICEVFKVEPLYDVLLERMMEKQNHGKKHQILKFTYVVQEGAFAVSKAVRDILWPANTRVSEIVSGNKGGMDDDGERKMHIGDVVTLFVQTYDEEQTEKELQDILGKQLSQTNLG